MKEKPIRMIWLRMFATRVLDLFGGPGWLFAALMVLAIFFDWIFRAS